ncbi:hypothetical protein OUZ56_008957 [Daphnia magna]|uniref:Uncharacterized protein n=1 Tax=Daphnia magna TaxID=35525 RepID=A0ABR0AEK4_9CRUS|nr:hypothetical protein OUZ56_008957 [Daphnia magna]
MAALQKTPLWRVCTGKCIALCKKVHRAVGCYHSESPRNVSKSRRDDRYLCSCHKLQLMNKFFKLISVHLCPCLIPQLLDKFFTLISAHSMDESDGGAPSDPLGSDRRCKHCNKTFQIVHNGHRCCTPECMKAQQALRRLSSSTSTATKKSNTWKKDTTQSPDKVDSNDTKNLCSALSLLENQLLVISELELAISRLSDDNVSVLESKVASLSSDLEIQEDQVKCLKDEAVQMKCADVSVPPLNVQAVEELLDTPNIEYVVMSD